MVHLESLRLRWHAQQPWVLDIPELHIASGERLFLHGPSGCGKSTLLGVIAGVNQGQSGQVTVQGQALQTLSSRARDRFRVDTIGFIFQQFNLIPYLSVLDNVLLPCRFSKVRSQRLLLQGKTPQAEAKRLLEQLDVSPDLYSKQAMHLSVGQQQRVAAARALLGAPPLIIADEPTSSLDAARQQRFIELLMQECSDSGATLLFVSHDQRLAELFPRQIALDDINHAKRAEMPS